MKSSSSSSSPEAVAPTSVNPSTILSSKSIVHITTAPNCYALFIIVVLLSVFCVQPADLQYLMFVVSNMDKGRDTLTVAWNTLMLVNMIDF